MRENVLCCVKILYFYVLLASEELPFKIYAAFPSFYLQFSIAIVSLNIPDSGYCNEREKLHRIMHAS
jgi:hypothetical protein